MDAADVADQIRETVEGEHHGAGQLERFKARAAVIIAILAMLLTLASLGGDNAMKAMIEPLWAVHDYMQVESMKRRDPEIVAILRKNNPPVAAEIDRMTRNSTAQTKTEGERALQLSFLSYLGNVKAFLLSVCSALTLALPSGVPCAQAGRKAEPQLFTPPCASVGQIVMKAGRSVFSEPRP